MSTSVRFDVERLGIDRSETFLKGVQVLVSTVVELDRLACTLAERQEFESERCFAMERVQSVS